MKDSIPGRDRNKARFGTRRAEVVDLLQRGVNTVGDLAHRLGLTNNAVRSHLIALERDGLARRHGSRPGTRRPHELYELTPRAQKYLAQASSATLNAMLEAMKQLLSANALRELLAASGEVLALRFGANDAHKPLPVRIKNAARVLNTLGGAAEVIIDRNAICLRSPGCPLAAVVAEHPETCQVVERFLAGMIQAPVRESCLRGMRSQCRFIVSDAGRRAVSSKELLNVAKV